jgi:hypothetical protein
MLADILAPSLGVSIETHYRSRTDRHLAATALAVRWYVIDHDGKLPATLDLLVPAYLPNVSLDPFAAGQQLRYRPSGERPVIYSVGRNGADDGGSEEPLRGGEQNRNEWYMKDRVAHASVVLRPVTTQPVNDQ